MSYQSMEEAKLRGEKENIPFWKAIQLEDAQERDVKIEDSWEKMKYMWQSMLDALDAYEPDKVSRSGLVGTEGGLMDNYRENEEPLCGDFVSKVMSNALKMGCNNACMKRIVAAPTAGACGVLPAVLVTYYKEYNVPEEKPRKKQQEKRPKKKQEEKPRKKQQEKRPKKKQEEKPRKKQEERPRKKQQEKRPKKRQEERPRKKQQERRPRKRQNR